LYSELFISKAFSKCCWCRVLRCPSVLCELRNYTDQRHGDE